ncbi:MAG TPA: ABC transporter permease [Blastocatellia bacterium]|nr:ABC transporter permease [Blastocatellia bacterium]
METIFQDLRYGVRMLVKSPGFTIVAVVALALGIGANTAIFSVVNNVLLRPLPYSDPGRLMTLRSYNIPKHPDFPVSPGDFLEWQDQNTVFDGMCAYRTGSYNLIGSGEPERLRAGFLSAGLITMLGVTPASGRDFLPEEDQEGSAGVVLISHGLWQRRFGRDPNIIGQSLTLSGSSFTVIGIMPPTFKFPEDDIELWTPIAFDSDDRQSHGAHFISVVGRLKPGVSVNEAQSEMDAIAGRLREQFPNSNSGWYARVTPMLDYAVANIKPALLVMLCAVAFVLLIACANVANLLLARAAARQKEVAIRRALGAGRWRIVRQLLTESVLLALVGGGVGLLIAVWGVDALVALAPEDLPRVRDVGIDRYALLFTFAITLLTGVIFGLAPAVEASKPNLNETLKDAGRGSTGGLGRKRLSNLLVIAEVALALVLLVSGGLMMRSFLKLLEVNPGFNPQNVLTVNISLPFKKYSDDDKQAAFVRQLSERVAALPGAQSVGVTNVMPIVNDFNLGFVIEGQPRGTNAELPSTKYYGVSPDFFAAMGIPLLSGRVFTERDNKDSTRVVIINETMARRYFPGVDPIGKRMHITMGKEIWREIVGVVGDVKQNGLDHETPVQTYEPLAQEPSTFMTLVVRSESDPMKLSAAIRGVVLALDSEQPVYAFMPLDRILDDSVAQQRFSMLLLAIFATVALVLAAVGLYGVMAYSVTQRTHELGIRMALGASSRDVLRLVIGQGFLLTLIGVGIGLTAAFFLTRMMESLLFGVSATDPATFAAISAMLAGVSLLASYIPARRAMKVDPMVALRYE